MAGIALVQANIFAPQDLLLVLLLALFCFGGQQLPAIAKGLGQGLREFKRASEGADDAPTPAVPRQLQANHGGATGTGEQRAPAGLPHDKDGPGPG
jgi:sec-independent protein translocase protein TatA